MPVFIYDEYDVPVRYIEPEERTEFFLEKNSLTCVKNIINSYPMINYDTMEKIIKNMKNEKLLEIFNKTKFEVTIVLFYSRFEIWYTNNNSEPKNLYVSAKNENKMDDFEKELEAIKIVLKEMPKKFKLVLNLNDILFNK